MPVPKPLPLAVAALRAVVRRYNLLDADSIHRLRMRLVRDGVADLPSLRHWLQAGDVNRRVGRALGKLLPIHDDQRIGDCHVLAHLTDGGMGSVDLVEHGGQLRVCKTIKAGQQGPNVAKRFRREAGITATFDHPHLVRCFGHGGDGERLYLVLEWIPGGDVQQLVEAGGPLGAAEALIILHQAALGLGHAHAGRLVHRDIKPANLLVTEGGTIRVADFGLARSESEDASWMTAAGATVGTPSYMAPEQIRGADLDGRADLYALGCVLHFCLTGHPPWNGTIADVLHGHLDLDPPDPALKRTDLPPALCALHWELLAKAPANRPPSAGALAERSAALLRALQRDPEDGLGPRAVAASTTRYRAPVVTEPEEPDTNETADDRPSDPTTRRLAREVPPDDLASALRGERLMLTAAPPGDGRIVAVLLAGAAVGIGRDSDVVVGDDPTAGRRHCRLTRYDDAPAVVDGGSANGTWLDGRWLPPDRPHPLSAERDHQLRLADGAPLALRAFPQRTAPVPGLGPDGLGDGSGWDGVSVRPAQGAPVAWVLRRLVIGPADADVPLASWQGPAVEIARWDGAWVWRSGDTWQALTAGALRENGVAVLP